MNFCHIFGIMKCKKYKLPVGGHTSINIQPYADHKVSEIKSNTLYYNFNNI